MSKPFFSTATSLSSMARVPAAVLSSISTARPVCGAAKPSTTPVAGNTTRSPGHRSFLSLAAHGLEVPLSPAHCLRFRTSRGHERLQGPAGALGQGPHANRKKDPPESFQIECSLARQNRGLLPPYGQHQLPADDIALDPVAARDDRALLSGLVPDAGD